MEAYEKIAKILRADRDYIADIERRFETVTGKKGAFSGVFEENEKLMKDRMFSLGVAGGSDAKEIYDALISKIESDDRRLFQSLGSPDCRSTSDCQRIVDVAKGAVNPPKGFFLKLDKAREFLTNEPPKKVMQALGYSSVSEMLTKEDLFEIYSALRFVEGGEWLNSVFFKQYEKLGPDDFEEREIEVRALSDKWGKSAKEFVLRKRHNISHLKELGVVFVIPTMLGISGEILRMFVLILHYLHEIPFYSSIFSEITKTKVTFANNFTSLLRGDVLNRHFPDSDKSLWLVVQRYLAKDDENDWRLFVPHINPEAIHWAKASANLAKIGDFLDGFSKELVFWENLDWVGDYFKDEIGRDTLVSFNIVDAVMSLVKEKEMVKYLYHHQEALWNKIFVAYFGEDELEKKSKDYLLQGYFEV